jgi:hypothetical protein
VGECTVLAFFVLLLLQACSDNNNNSPGSQRSQPVNPAVEGPITGGGGPDCCRIRFGGLEIDLRERGYVPGTPFYAGGFFDLAEVGYQEKEYFISGIATSYVNSEELQSDGKWSVMEGEGAEYNSRIVVQRPIDADDFNGTVVVEWFNVSGGLDAAPDWLQTHTELHREGYVWVGVSAQRVGIDGGGPFGLPLKTVDSERYGDLDHPGDSFAYDIFSQAAQAVRRPVGLDPMEGLKVERMIAVGQSQASFHLTSYYNAINPTLDIFDAYLVHSRARNSAPLSQQPQVEVPVPDVVYLREDQLEPAIMLQTETDLFSGLDYYRARQVDSQAIRLWEVAGSSHSDAYTTIKAADDKGDDPEVADVIATTSASPPFIECELPINDGPGHWVAKAAVSALNTWVRDGMAAPMAPRLQLDTPQAGFELDANGNALGGIRTPYVDTPVATLSGLGQGEGFCDLFGTTTLFDAAGLAELYPTREGYIDTVDESTDAAVAAGFLVPADAELIRTWARISDRVPP